jgi:hypothetical protein
MNLQSKATPHYLWMEAKVTYMSKGLKFSSSKCQAKICSVFSGEAQLCRCTTAAQGPLTLWHGDSTLATWWSWCGSIRARKCCGTRQPSVVSLLFAVRSLCLCCICYLLLHSWWSPKSEENLTVCKQARFIDRLFLEVRVQMPMQYNAYQLRLVTRDSEKWTPYRSVINWDIKWDFMRVLI